MLLRLDVMVAMVVVWSVGTSGIDILGAGPGTTGTRSIAEALVRFGVEVSHFGWYYNKTARRRCPLPYENSTKTLGLELCGLRASAGADAPSLALSGFGEPWSLMEAVFDSPVPEFFPYFYRMNPHAKVILTQRESAAWVRSRQIKHRENAPVPLMNMFPTPGACEDEARQGTHLAQWPLEAAMLAYDVRDGVEPRGGALLLP